MSLAKIKNDRILYLSISGCIICAKDECYIGWIWTVKNINGDKESKLKRQLQIEDLGQKFWYQNIGLNEGSQREITKSKVLSSGVSVPGGQREQERKPKTKPEEYQIKVQE